VRVALLDHSYGTASLARPLALALTAAGHDAEVLTAGPRSARAVDDGVTVVRRRPLPDAPLRLRKIGDRPGRMPGALAALVCGRYDLAHAFTPQDAAVAVLWPVPAVFTCPEPLNRAVLADRRRRLALWRRAVEDTGAVVAPDPDVAASLRRWLAVEPRSIEPASGKGHLALYRELLRPTAPAAG
jgi:hypothetical protein